LPFLIPLPIPGLSTPFGIMISLVGLFLLLKKPAWLPGKFGAMKISGEAITKFAAGSEKIWLRVSRLVKERLRVFHDSLFFRVINFFVFFVNGILLALPLPIPFSNTVPTIAIVLCALGYVERDGVFIVLSYLWCVFVGFFFSGLVVGVTHFIK
jgi:hypothetical protein